MRTEMAVICASSKWVTALATMRRWPSSNCSTGLKSRKRLKTPALHKQRATAVTGKARIESQAMPGFLFLYKEFVYGKISSLVKYPFRMAESYILSATDLYKSYGANASKSVVIDGLSFALRRGECYGLLGPNG